MFECQESVLSWANQVFGSQISLNVRTAVRANEEMSELLTALTINDNNPNAIEECADIVILLYVLVGRMGGNLLAEVDRKMAVNRSREWSVDTSGHGYHVRNKAVADG